MRILRNQGLDKSHYSRRKRRSLSPYEQSVEQWHADARARAHTEVHVQEAAEASPPQQKRAHPSSHEDPSPPQQRAHTWQAIIREFREDYVGDMNAETTTSIETTEPFDPLALGNAGHPDAKASNLEETQSGDRCASSSNLVRFSLITSIMSECKETHKLDGKFGKDGSYQCQICDAM